MKSLFFRIFPGFLEQREAELAVGKSRINLYRIVIE